MLLTEKKIGYLSSITHEGKVLLFGVDETGTVSYTVRQTGFEDTALDDDGNDTGFEQWKPLKLDAAVDDPSVLDWEIKELTDSNGNPLIRSKYGRDNDGTSNAFVTSTGKAPVQLVSGMGHLYVFRLSLQNTIMVSRYVLDGVKNELVPKLEVRFRRSRQKLVPEKAPADSARALEQNDSLDYRDLDRNLFYEPCVELSFIENLDANGWFAPVLTPTAEHNVHRWNIFAYDSALNDIVLYSVRAGEDGLFDLKDSVMSIPDENGPALHHIPGVIKRQLDFQGLTPAGYPAAKLYHTQTEQMTVKGEAQLVKGPTRVMLAAPVLESGETVKQTAALSFSVGKDGTLSKIDAAPTLSVLRAKTRNILLPLSTLDSVKPWADTQPAANGTIARLGRGDEDRVRITSVGSLSDLESGKTVRIKGTRSYDGRYQASNVTDTSFEVEAVFENNETGFWEVDEEEDLGLEFDNMILSCEKTDDDKLKVVCNNHDLEQGDEILVTGTREYDGYYPVREIGEDNSFVVDVKWNPGEAVNLSAVKRRGMVFDGTGDVVITPELELPPPAEDVDLSRTVSGWFWWDGHQAGRVMVAQEDLSMCLKTGSDNKVRLSVHFSDGVSYEVADPALPPVETWVHYAGVADYDAKGGVTRLYLCRDGELVNPEAGENSLVTDKMLYVFDEKQGLKPVLFQGGSDLVKVPNFNGFPVGSLTVSFWIKTTETASVCPFSYATNETSNAFSIRNPDNLWFYVNNHDSGYTGINIADGKWHHVAFSWNHTQGDVYAYKDGVRVYATTGVGVGSTIQSSGYLVLGQEQDSLGGGFNADEAFEGQLAMVSIWDFRTDDQVTEIYRRLKPPEPDAPGLIGAWIPEASVFKDLSASPQNGVVEVTPAPNFTAVEFGGGNDLVRFSSLSNFPTTTVALSFWIKTEDTSSGCPFSYATTESPDAFAVRNPKNLYIYVNGYGSDYTDVAVNDGKWHHLAILWRSSDGRFQLYKDGVLAYEESGVGTGETVRSSGYLILGQDQDSYGGGLGNDFTGQLANLSIWSSFLSASRIKKERRGEFNLATSYGLKHYWKGEGVEFNSILSGGPDGVLEGVTLKSAGNPRSEVTLYPKTVAAQDAIAFKPGDGVTLPAMDLDFRNGITIEAWVKYDAAVTQLDIFNLRRILYGTPRTLVQMRINGASITSGPKVMRFLVVGDPGVLEFHADKIPGPDTWFHLAVTLSSTGEALAYLNGEEFDSRTMYLPVLSDCESNSIGSFTGDADAVTSLAEVRLWNKARSASQIKNTYKQRLKASEPGLLGCWVKEGDQFTDLSSKAHHGTFTGAPSLTEAPDISARAANSRFFIGGDTQQGMKGRISELQIWGRAQSPAEIKAGMNLRLQGNELDLLGNWRLGGVLPLEDGRITPDFSVHSLDAQVVGETHVSAHELKRACASGKVVKYSNSELFAVSQGGTYQEAFQFKAVRANGTTFSLGEINNADTQGNPIFTFSYWGRSSRAATDQISFPSYLFQANDFQDLGDGWFQASCKFTVPKGVTMVRCFELDNVKGRWANEAQPPSTEWVKLEIRKHGVTLVSDSITRETYVDEVSLSDLADPQKDITLTDLENAEILIGEKKDEVKDLTLRLAVAGNNQKFRDECTQLEARIAQLVTSQTAARKVVDDLIADPLNFWCVVRGKGSGKVLDVYGARDDKGTNIIIWPRHGHNNQLWEFEPHSDGWYSIKSRDSKLVLDVKAHGTRNGSNLQIYTYHGKANQLFKLEGSQGGNYIIRGKESDKVVDVAGYSTANGANVYIWGHHGKSNQQWSVEKTSTLTANGALKVDDARKAKAIIDRELAEKRKRLKLLEDLLALAEEVPPLETALGLAVQALSDAETDFNSKNTTLLTAISNNQQLPQKLTMVKRDDRSLVTHGGQLGFVRPLGGLTMTDSCEGHLMLHYVDENGCMKTTRYDAAADSRDPGFEQWLPNSLRSAVKFSNDHEMLVINDSRYTSETERPVLEDNLWTVEAWHQYPGAVDAEGMPHPFNVIAAVGDDDDYPLVIKQGKRLGTVVDGFFFDYGLDLEKELEHGWHHLTAVGEQSTTSLYIDGIPVGQPTTPEKNAVVFNGNNSIRHGSFDTFPTTDITVGCWMRLTPNINDVTIFRFARYSSQHYFKIWHDDVLGVAVNGSHRDTTLKLDDDRWHHVAVTWSGSNGIIKVYVDGEEKWTANIGQGPQIYSGTLIYMGETVGGISQKVGETWGMVGWDFRIVDVIEQVVDPFTLKIAGLSVWDTVRTVDDIERDMYRLFEGNESNLVAYWNMETLDQNGTMQMKDLKESGGKHLSLHGNPEVITLSSQCKGNLSTIGNGPGGGSPAGAMCELRVWKTPLRPEEVAAVSRNTPTGWEPGLSAWYPLNEAEGTTALNHAAGGGMKAYGPGDRWIVCTAAMGKQGRQVFDFGGDASVEDSELTLAGDFTIEFWARRTGEGQHHMVVSHGHSLSTNNYLHLGFRSNNVFRFSFYGNDLDTTVTYTDKNWHHWACVYDRLHSRGRKIYCDGVEVASAYSAPLYSGTGGLKIGKTDLSDSNFEGQIAEVVVWDKVHTADEIKAHMEKGVGVDQDNMVLWWQLYDNPGDTVRNLSGSNHPGAVAGVTRIYTSDLPVFQGADVVASEYDTIAVDPEETTRRTAMMRRFYAVSRGGGVDVLNDMRVEDLELKWIGNAQFEPTLLGYIESPPPVPSENLTVEWSYDGAAWVQLMQTDEVNYRWDRSSQVSHGLDLNLFLGAGWGVEGGFGIKTKISEGKAGFRGSLNYRNVKSSRSSVTTSSTETLTDRLELRGHYENRPQFPNLGNRYVPKNVGYALVVSGLADVFITRLKRSGRMVSYQIRPVEGMPPDINTITFKVNPGYVRNGSLDGQVGSQAADPTFYRNVPEMRAQYGSLYPASYLRLREAYDLKSQIDRQDADREAYFVNFDATEAGEGALYGQTADDDQYDQYGEVTINEQGDEEDTGKKARTDAFKKAKKDKKKEKEKGEKRQREIKDKYADIDKRLEASAGFDAWQQRMENLQIRAAKRNLANTYVWDADGGLRAEEQSFMNTVEHTVGGSLTVGGTAGGEADVLVGPVKFELTALYAGEMTQTMSKSIEASRGFELRVGLEGVENKGITDQKDYPLQPGEKVDRYRFMSFYLEGATRHFEDFFNKVVDPEWLMSNDEEARALRQVMAGRPNKTWRILHRVTYVERPALMGFGRDLRPVESMDDTAREVMGMFDAINEDATATRAELTQIQSELSQLSGKIQALLSDN